jgi:uncharacterized protein (DUF169 family)
LASRLPALAPRPAVHRGLAIPSAVPGSRRGSGAQLVAWWARTVVRRTEASRGMHSKIAAALQVEIPPVAIVLADAAPEGAFMIPEGKWGCAMWLLASAAKGRAAAADRQHFGCLGGGTGLGFGNQYENWPGGIDCFYYFLSTGNEQWERGREAMGEARPQLRKRAFEHFVHGERYLDSPERVQRFVEALPMTDVQAEVVLFQPLAELAATAAAEVVVFLVDADRMAALAILAGFARDGREHVIMPQAAGCQSIGIYAFHENRI